MKSGRIFLVCALMVSCRAKDDDEQSDDETACDAQFTLSMPDGSWTSLDYCKASSMDATFEFDPDRPPEVRAPTLRFSSVGTGSFDCSITIREPSACGPGYYRMGDLSGVVLFTTFDCKGVGDAYEGSYTSNWGYLKLTVLSAGNEAGDLSDQPLMTTIAGRVDVYTDTDFRLEGSFSLSRTVSAGDAEEAPCQVSDGDEDNDGYIDSAFGGTDPDDSDPTVPNTSDDSSDDSSGGSSDDEHMSCLFAEGHVCYETNEPDDEGWCRDKAGESSDSQCPSGEDGHCIFTPGGDFTGWATAYYYSDFPGEESCEAGNGTYTAN